MRIPQVLSYLEQHSPDVLCVQETKCEDSKFPIESLRAIGYDAVFHGQKSYNGVAIISRLRMEDVEKSFRDTPVIDQARFIRASVNSIVILNAYVPNGGFVGSDKFEYKLSWLKGLRRYLDSRLTPESNVLLCGDFNVAPEDRDVYNPERMRGQLLCSDQERLALDEVTQWGFKDSFRMFTEETGHYTWWDYRVLAFKRKMGFRIDHVFLSEPLSRTCKRAWIDIEPRKQDRASDHTPLLVELS